MSRWRRNCATSGSRFNADHSRLETIVVPRTGFEMNGTTNTPAFSTPALRGSSTRLTPHTSFARARYASSSASPDVAARLALEVVVVIRGHA